jgi:hypothetical protein
MFTRALTVVRMLNGLTTYQAYYSSVISSEPEDRSELVGLQYLPFDGEAKLTFFTPNGVVPPFGVPLSPQQSHYDHHGLLQGQLIIETNPARTDRARWDTKAQFTKQGISYVMIRFYRAPYNAQSKRPAGSQKRRLTIENIPF